LRGLFAGDDGAVGAGPEATRDEEELRAQAIDEAVLRLVHLNASEDRRVVLAWKTFDWDAIDRLHERGLISDPESKAKYLMLTEEGRNAAGQAFQKLLAS
jgi:hypothetical protein